MNKLKLCFLLFICCAFSPVTMAKGIPLFFNTGDELFEVEDAPAFDDGYKVGYACERLGVFGADIWTWNCKLMAINVGKFSAGDLPEDMIKEFNQKYSESDRIRNPWNHYGAVLIIIIVAGFTLLNRKKKAADSEVSTAS
jgi:ABC-type multidrug transport system permease subunit